MKTTATRRGKDSPEGAVLYMAFELGDGKWVLRFSDGGRIRDKCAAHTSLPG